jgi:hypothetical protein
MNGMSPQTSRPSFRRLALLSGVACFVLAATGCVHYKAHVRVSPAGELHVQERAEMLPGVADSMRLEPKLVWTAFEAATLARGGQFSKERPDSLKAATSDYPLDTWSELGQRGPTFKGIDEIERRTRPANVQFEVEDQYFYTVTTLGYNHEMSEPSGSAVDSVWAPWVQQAQGEVTIEVPGEIITTNATQRAGNRLTYPFRYGETLDIEVSYKQMQWVAIVSVVLVGIFLLYLIYAGIRAMAKGKKPPAEKTA